MTRQMIRWVLVLLALAGVFAGLRFVHSIQPEPEPSAIYTPKLVVVGIEGRYRTTPVDDALLSTRADAMQVGAISIRPRYLGDCAAAGWTTLGSGRRAAVGTLCDPQVVDGKIADWPDRLAAAQANRGDAKLGTLAAESVDCVAAVGPGAALAAAQPDGTIEHYQSPESLISNQFQLSCPVTLVDAGAQSDQIIEALAKNPDVTLIVTGIGPVSGSKDPRLQLIYRLGTTLPGWLASPSTDRHGIVLLSDLTRTMVDFSHGDPSETLLLPIDGSALSVDPGIVSVQAINDHLRAMDALSSASTPVFIAMGVVGALVVGAMIICIRQRRFAVLQILGSVAVMMTAAMVLTGIYPWQNAKNATITLGLVFVIILAALTAAALGLARLLTIPIAVAGAGLTVAILTADAALGGLLQPGSLLALRPTNGSRWYGFGNVTFSAYAAAGLVLGGWVAHRLLAAEREFRATVAVLAIGFGIVICEGWPSMGTDFGGVIALTPAVLLLAFKVSGLRVTWLKVVITGVSAVLAIAAISLLDWRRPVDERSHLGNFVQRIIDGDALDVVARKAATSVGTMITPLGIGSILLGAALWFVFFRYLIPQLVDTFSTLQAVAVAALATTILGTVLNDGGISVIVTLTSAFSFTIASLWFAHLSETGSVSFRGRHSLNSKPDA